MKDRIPTKILSNGALRYGVYDDSGNLLRYEYIRPADEPTQEGDPLCKETLLPDDVATALGLTGNPQVKDALEVINDGFVDTRKYWWEKYSLQMIYEASIGSYTSRNVGWSLSGDPAMTLYTGYTINQSTGAITPTGGTTVTIASGTGLSNYYCYPYLSDGSLTQETVLYKCSGAASIPSTATFRACQCAPVTAVQTGIKGTYADNVSSYSVDTYPANGAQGDYWYVSLGQSPLLGTRIATGLYTGTGTYGSSNKNSLAFNFVPKLIIIASIGGILGGPVVMVNPSTIASALLLNNYSSEEQNLITVTWSNKTVSWYSSSNYNNQRNARGQTYYYIAIG